MTVAARVAGRDIALDGRVAEPPDELAGAEVLIAVVHHPDPMAALGQALRGRAIHPGVRVTVTPSSHLVDKQAEGEGILELFRTLGAVVTPPGCGSCIGNGPGIPLPGETTASTTNRNFDRRMGAPGPVYLVSPAVAAASAVTGHLTDPRTLE